MSKSNNSCQAAYNQGLKARKKSPFNSGSLYKIREFHRRLESLPENLINIGRCFNGNKISCRDLMGCDKSDKAFYTKKMPRNIAYDFGYEVVSALPALRHDGLPQADLDRITLRVNFRIESMINAAEQSFNELKGNWAEEARHLAYGQGVMYEFSHEALMLVSWIVEEVELCKR